MLAHALGASTLLRYLVLCALLVLLTYVLLYVQAGGFRAPSDSALAVLLFAAHPIGYSLQSWLGMADAPTVLCTVGLLFARSAAVLGLASFLLMSNHTAAPFVAAAIVALSLLAREGVLTIRHVFAVAMGLVLSKALIVIALHIAGIDQVTRLQYIAEFPWTAWLGIHVAQLPLILCSMNVGFWIPVALMVALFFNDNRRFYACYLLVLASSHALALLTRDTTRVYALLTWGATLYCLLHTWRLASDATAKGRIFRVAAIACALFGWCFPRLSIWDGAVHAPWFQQLIGYLSPG